MKQVMHAEAIVSLLNNDIHNVELPQLLDAQLSHADGIRGFMVTYLTIAGESVADNGEIPPPLSDILLETVERNPDLVSLACMNVIMPTAMMTMHSEKELQEQSKLTAERGAKILKLLLEFGDTQAQCEAILSVAKGDARDTNIREIYWKDFFEKWNYGDEQRSDICNAMESLLK